PLICIFQPHQAKRLNLLFKDFLGAFDDADIIFILPLYKVLGRDKKFPHDSETLVRAMKKRTPKKPIFYLSQQKKIRNAVETTLRSTPFKKSLTHSPVLVMMGAGDIADLTTLLLK
ncbi:MAG TPA: hypothetical protein VMR99_00595, partial [Candidatus Paceibacterota bacterium]|nr:hypothetical protein [Candidatus Paceibacterota bacterium]